MNLLETENLVVGEDGIDKKDRKEILKGVNLKIKLGQVQAFLGPNASGKTTLAQVIAGNPKFKITKGKIFFNNKDITKFSPEKRTQLGIVLSWQNPIKIKGVKLSQLLKKISKNKAMIKQAENLLDREVNSDISGGEKKISELLQILRLNPKLVIFDEIDSGLDIKRLELVAQIIKKELIQKGVAVLIITHSGEILEFLKPDITNVMVCGKIICQEKDYKKVLKTIRKYNYQKCKKCQLHIRK